MDVGAWLRGLGLAQYETAFRDNALDADILPQLTDFDLKEVGVTPLGHRKRLLKAIALMNSTTAGEFGYSPEAERRPITVMFCDLVGSTVLATQLDPEDWRDLVEEYLNEAVRAATQFDGYVLKKLGDGLMVLFGYPRAQENDAERACRAGLAVLHAFDEVNTRNFAYGRPMLSVRIGLDSGPVVVDATGEVFGEAPNVAARVQAAADPGTLLVSYAVQRQVAGLFVAEDKGPHELKGVSGRPTLWRIVRPSGGGRRAGARSPTTFVGREQELGALLSSWDLVMAGKCQFVQIVGEAGLGKSRLMEEFRTRLAEVPHTWVEWTSSQLLQNTPLHPIAQWGRRQFVGDRRVSELETMLALVNLDPAEHASLLAPLLDIPLPATRTSNAPPDEIRRRQLSALVSWLLASATLQAVVLAIEDLHWADPTTLELLTVLVEQHNEVPLLIVATSRPEFFAPWATRPYHLVLQLAALDRAEVRKMVAAIASRHALEKDVVEGLSDRTGGVPLFIEEVTRLMLEGGVQNIPPTLQQSLAARLDRLGQAREVAQIGAVLGREFTYHLLQAVARLNPFELDAGLEKLTNSDLLFVEGIAPNSNYRFKHVLIQDAAYERLLKSRRQALHRAAAAELVATPDLQPELIAHHFTQGGETDLAIEWWGKSGDTAFKRSAFAEAIAHFGKAIDIASRDKAVFDETERRHTGLKARYAQAMLITKGHTADETKAAFERLDVTHDAQPDEAEQVTTLYGRWTQTLLTGPLPAALTIAENAFYEGHASGRTMLVATTHRWISYTKYYLGSFAESRYHAQCALDLYNEYWSDLHGGALAFDFLCGAHLCLALPQAVLGEVESAAGEMELAAKRAHDSGQPFSIAQSYIRDLQRLWLANRPQQILSVAEALRAVFSARGVGAWDLHTKLYASWASGRLTNPSIGSQGVREAWSRLQQNGERLSDTRALIMLADLGIASGAADEALNYVAEALQVVEAQSAYYALSPLLRIRGEALSLSDARQAEQAFRESISVARRQGARSFEVQAALRLAELLQSANRQHEAREILSSAMSGFSITPELPAVKEGYAWLATLA